ncbi:hypothetical protein PAPHI01_0668 [Pancytospora philotis]|nr:hypothetical protein PAPHI01_0668 [Pancytospora philotis]
MRPLAKMISCCVLFVGARLDMDSAVRALTKQYYGGVYVNPEGPLNILRAYPLLSNDMVSKKRKYATLMRTDYAYAYDEIKDDLAYERDGRFDNIRRVPGTDEATKYLETYYKALKSVFTVIDGVVSIDEALAEPFTRYYVDSLTREKRQEFCAILLLLAGGADIRIKTSHQSKIYKKVEFILPSAADENTSPADNGCAIESLLETRVCLGSGNPYNSAWEVLEFLKKYSGANVSQLEAYGLHYTDTPSFLIQAYVSEIIASEEELVGIYEAAYGFLAELLCEDNCAPMGVDFFSTDGVLTQSYAPAYAALLKIDKARAVTDTHFIFPHHAPPSYGHCASLRPLEEICHCPDAAIRKHPEAALFYLCYCLCFDRTIGRCSTEHIRNTGNNPSQALCEFFAGLLGCSGRQR